MDHEFIPESHVRPSRRKRRITLTLPEVAKIVGVTNPCVLAWIRKGKLTAAQDTEGFWQIWVADLERFLTERTDAVTRRTAFVEAPAKGRFAVQQLGFTIVRAETVADALTKLKGLRPELFVLDANSMRIPALTLLEEAKKRKLTKGAQLLLIGEIPDSEINRAARVGVRSVAASVDELPAELERLFSPG